MESNIRLIAKSISWQSSGIIMMTLICYLITGSINAGGLIAVVSAVVGLATFYLHEKLWSRISWGRQF
tara:strand:- start:3037 stop:3240 length:204 start_codon:yes stop_codon:yes gene_type:complete